MTFAAIDVFLLREHNYIFDNSSRVLYQDRLVREAVCFLSVPNQHAIDDTAYMLWLILTYFGNQ